MQAEKSQLAATHPIEFRLFHALDDDGDGYVSKPEFRRTLDDNGLSRKDPRLAGLYSALDEVKGESFEFATFLGMIHTVAALIERMLFGELAVPD